MTETIQSEVAIIGAGPAGTATAIHLGQLGVKNVVLVDRADFPRDKTCGSAVSPKGLKVLEALGVWNDVHSQSYWISGLRLVTGGGREIWLSGGDAASAIVCCRRTLDHLLLERAVSLGVRFVPNFYVTSLIHRGDRVVGFRTLDGRTVRARFTVVADGAHSTLTDNPKPRQIIQAIMGWWDHVDFKPKHVEMIFDNALAPYYGWLFPESETRVNIGICYEDLNRSRNARRLFREFLEAHYGSRLRGATQVGDWKGHQISYSYTMDRLYSPGRLIVGEAGRMTHPGTAEGIYQGMRSGMLAASAVKDILAGRADELRACAAYESNCRRAFYFSFAAGKLWRSLVSAGALDRIVSVAQTRGVQSALAGFMARM